MSMLFSQEKKKILNLKDLILFDYEGQVQNAGTDNLIDQMKTSFVLSENTYILSYAELKEHRPQNRNRALRN